ncbi:MAG: efflux RND transporter periplasmic adaptor subunit [Mucinivorans sp.]
MRTKILSIIGLSILTLSLTGCWTGSEPRNFTRPVRVAKVEPLMVYDKEFVGVVSAVEYTDLAFRVAGLVTKTFIVDGTFVKKGQLVAELDPGDFELQLSADKAQFVTTKSILERNERLLAKQAISQQDYEIAKSNYLKAKSSYEYTSNQLGYTKLRAPFSGSVEKKYVENYQKINAGQAICRIVNPDMLQVKFVLPESDIQMTKLDKGYFVEFDNYRGELFSAKITEVVDVSVDGAGIPVTLAITDKKFNPQKYDIKSGFACRVKVQIENKVLQRQFLVVPITALFSQEGQNGKSFVWVYDAVTSTVNLREVTRGGLMGVDRVMIASGLNAGETVVTAGVYQIVDKQKVTLL